MKQKSIIFICLGVAAGLIAVATTFLFNLGPQRANASSQIEFPSTLPDTPLTDRSTPQEVLALMLYSEKTWDTVNLSATETTRSYEKNKQGSESTTYLQIEQPNKAYVERTLNDQKYIWHTDGNTVFTELADLNIYTTQPIPIEVKNSFENFSPPTETDLDNPIIYPHPFGVGLPTILSDQIYPTGIAQNMWQNGKIEVLGEEKISNRSAIVLLRQHTFEDGTIAKKHIYWIDANTGVILKYQVCTPENEYPFQEYGCNWMSQVTITQIQFNAPITDNKFNHSSISPESKFISWEDFEKALWGQSYSAIPLTQQEKE